MPAPQHPMLQFLVDLESPFDASVERGYDPVELVRYALTWETDYWPSLALAWLEQGVQVDELLDELQNFETEAHRPQTDRHRARRLRRRGDADRPDSP